MRQRPHRCQQLKRILCHAAILIPSVWLAVLLAFRVLPVPYSAVMLERQLSAFWQGHWHYRARSEWINLDQIAPAMALAVIAAEDQKFPQHWGFDTQSISQALRQHHQQQQQQHHQPHPRLRGASTLSQQTAKNLLLWNGRSWLRKGLEAVITLGLESLWSKKRILTVYLNIAEFGNGIFGVQAAARYYFHKPASQLSPRQAALLAATLPAPLRHNPAAPDHYLQRRQQWILQQMQQLGGNAFLSRHQLSAGK